MTKAEQFYRGLLAELEASGKTIQAFSQERGLPPNRLSWWRHKLKWRAEAAEGGATPALIPVQVIERDGRAVQGTSTAVGTTYDVVLKCGWIVRLPVDLDLSKAAQLVRSLDGSC